jgi:hypothetical protein
MTRMRNIKEPTDGDGDGDGGVTAMVATESVSNGG